MMIDRSAGARRRLGTMLAASTWVLLATTPAHADRDIRNLMSQDHHLVQSDFIGVIEIESMDAEGRELVRLRARVLETWSTRWKVQDRLQLSTTTAVRPFEVGGRYVVLLSGGAWHDAPLTHREHSVFRVGAGDRIACSNGLALYGVMSEGFLCTAPDLVVGAPLTLSGMRLQLQRARGRAAARQARLSAELDRQARPLEQLPVGREEQQEVRR